MLVYETLFTLHPIRYYTEICKSGSEIFHCVPEIVAILNWPKRYTSLVRSYQEVASSIIIKCVQIFIVLYLVLSHFPLTLHLSPPAKVSSSSRLPLSNDIASIVTLILSVRGV
jgi:hypothetical protein